MNQMNPINQDWLSQLASDHAPAAIGWWPLAIGWWIVIAVCIIAIAGFVYWFYRPAHRLRRLALRELDRIEKFTDDAMLAREVEHLLRRYALTRFGREQVAGLSGQSWVDFVVAHGGQAWAGDSGTRLLQAAYGGKVHADRHHWLMGARTFIQSKQRNQSKQDRQSKHDHQNKQGAQGKKDSQSKLNIDIQPNKTDQTQSHQELS